MPQMENAKVLEREGASIVIEDKDATAENLSEALTVALGKDKLNSMASNASALGRPEAAGVIVDEISKLGGEI